MDVCVFEIVLEKLDNIPSEPASAGANQPSGAGDAPEAFMEYARFIVAKIGQRFFGRSEPLQQGQTSFDFTADQRAAGTGKRPRWAFKRQFRTGDKVVRIPIVVEVWADQSADPPQSVCRVATTLELLPVKGAGTVELAAASGAAKLKLRYEVKSAKLPPAESARNTPPHTFVIDASTPATAVVEVTDIAGLHEPWIPSSEPLRWRAPRAASAQDEAADFRAGERSKSSSADSVAMDAQKDKTERHDPITPQGFYWEHRFSAPRRADYDRDDAGRVFLNRGHAGDWQSRHQSIILTAKVTMARGALPANAKIQWRVLVPDDPVTDHPEVRSEAWYAMHHPYVATQSKLPVEGPQWEPNMGRVIPAQAWEALAGFELSDVEETSAVTALVNDMSRVRLHCPNHSGDRLVVEVSVRTKESILCLEYVTGMLTTWHLIEVDYGALEGALPLTGAFAVVAQNIAPACFQFDFIDHGVMPVPTGADSYAARAAQGESRPGADWMEDRHLAYNDAEGHINSTVSLLLDEPKLFPHRGQPGWFALAAALLLHPPLRKGARGREWTGQAHVDGNPGGESQLLVPPMPPGMPGVADLSRGGEVAVHWGDDVIRFGVRSDGVSPLTLWQVAALSKDGKKPTGTDLSHRIAVEPQWLLPRFDINEGYDAAPEHFLTYYPADYVGEGPAIVDLLWPRERGGPLGWSCGPADWFDGGLVILTREDRFRVTQAMTHDDLVANADEDSWPPPIGGFDSLVAIVTVHEFSHSVNSHHHCGHWGHRHGTRSCAMNAHYVKAVRRKGAFVHGSGGRVGPEFCGMHISQMRRVIFQDNPVLASLGW
ncbi:MAG: hypothetical protein U0271_20225 [Polyangiaceae bacterium]